MKNEKVRASAPKVEEMPARQADFVIIRKDGDDFTVHAQGVSRLEVPMLLRAAAQRAEAQILKQQSA